jgi:hypothetical protein
MMINNPGINIILFNFFAPGPEMLRDLRPYEYHPIGVAFSIQ